MREKKFRVYYLLVLLIAGLLSAVELPELLEDGMTFRAFDVGQGDAFLFTFPGGGTMLVDAGPRKEGRALVGKLRRLGVRRIDILVATHPHEDHIGGMAEILRSFPVGKLWDSGYNHGSEVQREMLGEVRRKKIRFGKPRAGFTEERGGVKIEVLAPRAALSGTGSDVNNNSLILRVSFGSVSVLMMGDAEEAARAAAGPLPKSTVLKAAHHGSRDGTDEALLRQVEPEVVILSCGRGNSYGHPHRETLDRIAEGRARSRATQRGDIAIATDGRRYSVRQEEPD